MMVRFPCENAFFHSGQATSENGNLFIKVISRKTPDDY